MSKIVSLCAVAAAALVTFACKAAPDTHDADVKAIQATEDQWAQAYATKDATRTASYYADDAVLITPGAPAISGKDAIQKAESQFLSDPAASLQFHASRVDVAQSGDLGYTQGTYSLTMTDPQTHQVVKDHGNYVTDYRKQADGSWKAVADIAVSDVPPPPAPTPNAKKH